MYLLWIDNGLSVIDIVKCTAYHQFTQSLHCQFFHTDSSIYPLEGFQKFFRQLLGTAATMMNEVTSLFGRNRFVNDTPEELLRFAFDVLTNITAVTEDADQHLAKVFDVIKVDNEEVLVPCDELIDFLLSYQVVLFFSCSF